MVASPYECHILERDVKQQIIIQPTVNIVIVDQSLHRMVKDLYRATPAATQDIDCSGLIRRTIQARDTEDLHQKDHTSKGHRGPTCIVTQILTDIHGRKAYRNIKM